MLKDTKHLGLIDIRFTSATPDRINPNLCSHLIVGFALIDSQYQVQMNIRDEYLGAYNWTQSLKGIALLWFNMNDEFKWVNII